MIKSANFRKDYKIVLIGDSCTGKTSFVRKWTKDIFDENYNETIVSEFGFKVIEYEGNVFRIQLWDIPGKFTDAMIKIFLKDTHGALVLSDATNINTRENALRWKISVEKDEKFLDGDKLPFLLVESKCDLIGETPYYEEKLKDFAERNEFIGCLSVSSKTGKNVNESIEFLIKTILKRINDMNSKNNENISLNEKQNHLMKDVNKDEKKEKNYEKIEKENEVEEEKNYSKYYKIEKKDIDFYSEKDNLEIEGKKDGKSYYYRINIKQLQEKYEIFEGIEDVDQLVEILDELKNRDKVIVKYYLEDAIIQIGILVNNLLGEKEEITFELICENNEDDDVIKTLVKELKILKEKKTNEEENKPEDEKDKK